MNRPVSFINSLLRLVNRYARFLTSSGLRAVDLNPDHLLEDAARRAALDDFGDTDFMEPLRVLLDAYENEAELTLIGRIAMREDALQSLLTRLWIQDERNRHPKISDAGIRAPVFITGLPRTGTTFLHNLLAEDPGFRAPLGWEVMYPRPLPGTRADRPDPRIARAQRRMEQLYWLSPEFRVIHPLDASSPQECIAITGSAFASDVYPTMCHVPGYQYWLDRADLVPSFRYHRRFLQQLQGGQQGLRWLLKAPAHLFALDAIVNVYPDARFIFTHRDPLEVLPSLANLTLVLRGAFSDRHRPAEIGRELIGHWAQGMRRARESIGRLPDRPQRCMDITYEQLTGHPLDTVRRIYRHFDMELGDEAQNRMRTYLDQRPKDRFGRHRYSLEQFAFDAKDIERAFDGLHRYCD